MINGLKRIEDKNGEVILVKSSMYNITIIKNDFYVTLENMEEDDFHLTTNHTDDESDNVCTFEVDFTIAEFCLDKTALVLVELIKNSTSVKELCTKLKDLPKARGVTIVF